jgi:hypothetical protein
MKRATTRVVTANAASRATAIVAALLAFLMAAASILDAQDRLRAGVTILLFGVMYCVLIAAPQRQSRIAPMIVSGSELPAAERTWKVVARATLGFAVIDSAVSLYALAQYPQEYFLIGAVLSAPSTAIRMYMQTAQIERDFGGACWVPSSPWASYQRPRFIVRKPMSCGMEVSGISGHASRKTAARHCAVSS